MRLRKWALQALFTIWLHEMEKQLKRAPRKDSMDLATQGLFNVKYTKRGVPMPPCKQNNLAKETPDETPVRAFFLADDPLEQQKDGLF